jgi:hypothetical protein
MRQMIILPEENLTIEYDWDSGIFEIWDGRECKGKYILEPTSWRIRGGNWPEEIKIGEVNKEDEKYEASNMYENIKEDNPFVAATKLLLGVTK